MNKNPLVSVYIPVYNAQDYIDECLLSILNQSYSSIDIYAYLDVKSSDRSGKILEDYTKKYNNVYIKEKHGQADAIDEFVRVADGEIMVMVDNDDYLEKDLVKKIVDCFNKDDIDGVIYLYKYVDEKGNLIPWKLPVLEDKVVDIKEVISDFLTTVNVEGFRWNKAYRKGVYKDFNFVDVYPVDMPSEFNLFQRCKKMAYLNYYGYNYRQREDSWVATFDLDSKIDFLRVYKDIATRSMDMGLVNEGQYFLVWRYVFQMYEILKEKKKINDKEWKELMKVGSWNTYLNISLSNALSILNTKECRDSKLKMAIKAFVVYFNTKVKVNG